MSKVVDYYFSLISPWTYLGAARFADILGHAGATAMCRPVDFGKVFPASGGLPLGQRAPQRRAYRLIELRRWRDFLGIELTLEPKHFPTPEALAARLVIAAREAGADALGLSSAILRATWAEERDVSRRETLLDIAAGQRLDGSALLAAAEREDMGRAYERETEQAIARGVFGAPTYVWKDELFWGQDRLDFLARALMADDAGQAPPSG